MRSWIGARAKLLAGIAAFVGSREGSISLITALLLPTLIGIVALVAEFGNGLLTKSENQRVADLAAYAGAVAYTKDKSEATMRTAAQGVAVLNNVAAQDVTATLVASPRSAENQAVAVTIATRNQLFLSQVLDTGPELTIASQAFAEVGSAGKKPACILALAENQTGITMSGGTEMNANGCTVSSNAQIDMSGSAKIMAQSTQYATNLSLKGAAKIVGPATKVAPTADPLAGHEGIAAAAARMATVRAMTGPATANGTNVDFGWNDTAAKSALQTIGCTGTFASGKWAVSCPKGGTYKFGQVTTVGGIEVTFTLSGFSSAPTVFSFGKTTSKNCGFSICAGGGSHITIPGPAEFQIGAGFDIAGGSSLKLGVGSANAFDIGPGSGNKAVSLGGSATAHLGGNDVVQTKFQVVGNVQTAGSSCLVMSPAAQHDIKGNVDLVGAMLMGAGVYTIDGYFGAGTSGGGDGNCLGSNFGVKGQNVSLVVSGRERFPSGSCSNQAVCFGAGFKNSSLTAPTSGPLAEVAIIGPQDASITAGAGFVQGAAGSGISGLLYFPNGPVLLTGGASLGGTPSGCLQIIGSRIDVSGGTAAASECIALGGGGGENKKVSLVQ